MVRKVPGWAGEEATRLTLCCPWEQPGTEQEGRKFLLLGSAG